MDHGRKIGKTEEPNAFSRKLPSPSCSCYDPPLVPQRPPKEDNRLANWKKWLSNRQKHYTTYKSVFKRHQTQLIMNSCEDIRPFIEMRNVMDYANVPVPIIPDKYRGDPSFWKTPQRLFNQGDPCLPNIFAVMPRKDLNMPELEYVDVPKLLRREKNLVRPGEDVPKWKRSAYLSRRKRELANTLAMLEPHQPDATDFVVEGKAFFDKETVPARVPVMTITDDASLESSSEDLGCRQESRLEMKIVLKIQDLEIVRDECLFDELFEEALDPISWDVNFNTVAGRKLRSDLRFENKGTVGIVYDWRDESFASEALPLPRKTTRFFFNKNKGLILPGQITEFPVWFQANEAGFHVETWRIQLEPQLHPAPMIFRLSGFAKSVDAEDSTTKERSIEDYLDRCIRNTTIRESLEDTLHSLRPILPQEPAYRSIFLEGEVFRAKNPSCFYHANLVAELRKLYENVTGYTGPSWSLSLNDVRDVLLRVKNPEARHDLLLQFSGLCQESLKPCLFNPIGNVKYAMVYNIFCSMAKDIEKEGEYLRMNIGNTRSGPVSERSSALTSASRVSIGSTTPRAKRLNRVRLSRIRSLPITPGSPQRYSFAKETIEDAALFRELFYVRVYDLLAVAVEQTCAAIDSLNNLNEMQS